MHACGLTSARSFILSSKQLGVFHVFTRDWMLGTAAISHPAAGNGLQKFPERLSTKGKARKQCYRYFHAIRAVELPVLLQPNESRAFIHLAPNWGAGVESRRLRSQYQVAGKASRPKPTQWLASNQVRRNTPKPIKMRQVQAATTQDIQACRRSETQSLKSTTHGGELKATV